MYIEFLEIRLPVSAALSLALLLCAQFARAQQGPPENKEEFLTPQKSVRAMTFPDEFDVNVFAAEPDLVQPFAFTFDARGRIWAVENLNYRTRHDNTSEPISRIIILEDTDGDGRFDRKKTFYDELTFPTGLAVGHGGVWVGSPPNLLFIPDRNRDDRPDGDPQVVLNGWGKQDRHEVLNTFNWGPDGWLYGCQGVYTESNVGKPGATEEERTEFDAGIWRYHPVKERFEVFARGTSNPWGITFNRYGRMFITACVIPHLWHIIQGGRYRRQSGEHRSPLVYDDIKTIADHDHLSAHGGAAFYYAGGFPEKYRGRLFMGNIHRHGILTDVVRPRDGSGYVAKHGDDFLMANNRTFLGFNLKVGPDGAVYIIDWHDRDICGRDVIHGETGRIYRISTDRIEGIDELNLRKRSDVELVELLLHQNVWYVRIARRLLHERAVEGTLDRAKTEAALRKVFRENSDVSDRLRALRTLFLIDGISDEQLVDQVKNEEPRIRAWAIRLLCEDKRPPSSALEVFSEIARAEDAPVVRLQLASALQRIPPEDRWNVAEGLVRHGEDQGDHNIPKMIWFGIMSAVKQYPERAKKLADVSELPLIRRYVRKTLQ